MRVIVAGGDGYLGWPQAMYLSRKGHRVCVIRSTAGCGILSAPRSTSRDLARSKLPAKSTRKRLAIPCVVMVSMAHLGKRALRPDLTASIAISLRSRSTLRLNGFSPVNAHATASPACAAPPAPSIPTHAPVAIVWRSLRWVACSL